MQHYLALPHLDTYCVLSEARCIRIFIIVVYNRKNENNLHVKREMLNVVNSEIAIELNTG